MKLFLLEQVVIFAAWMKKRGFTVWRGWGYLPRSEKKMIFRLKSELL